MPLLTADEIRAAAARRRTIDSVDVPELGGEVRLQALCASDLLRLEHEKRKALLEGRNPEDCAFEYIACSWIDADGKPLLPIAEGIALARSLDQASYKKVVVKVAKLNGVSDEEIEAEVKN